MPYKIADAKLEAFVQDWPADWHEPVSAEELSTGPPIDALDEPVQEGKDLHDSDGESSTDSDLEAQHMSEEMHTKRHMEFDVGSSSHSMMENQLQRLIKVVTDAYDVAAQAMRVSSQEGIATVILKLDSILLLFQK